MVKSVLDLEVTVNRKLSKDQYLLTLQSKEVIQDILPGQFGNILVDNTSKVFLRRPFSVYSVNYGDNSVSFLIKVIGEGTRKIAEAKMGDVLNVVLPLGNGFTMPVLGEHVLLVGGGSGVAPMMHLAQSINTNLIKISILIGAKSVSDLVELDQFSKFGRIYITTEDGSAGEQGYVTNHSLILDKLNQFSRIYTCGPDPMMKAIASKADQKGIFCEVSLENTMACGFGVCLCCVTNTIQGHKCVCTEGPVFNINQLKWQI